MADLHNLFDEIEYRQMPATFRWNVADTETRTETIEDIVAFLRNYALLYFEQFTDSSAVISKLILGTKNCRGETSIPGFNLGNAIEYTLCFGALEQASAVLFRHNSLHANSSGTEIEKRFATFNQEGLSVKQLNGPGFPTEIMQLAHIYELT